MRSKSLVLSLVVGVLWGSSFLAIDVGLSYFPPLLFAGLRYALVGVVVVGFAALLVQRWHPQSLADVGSILVAGAFMIAGHHAFLYLGMDHLSGSSAVAAIVVSLSPALTAVFASALLPDSDLTALQVVGLLVGLAGVVVISDIGVGTVASADLLGVGLVMLATVSFAFGSVATRPLRTDLSAVALQGWAMLLGAGLLGVTSYATGESATTIVWTPLSVASLAFLVVGPGIIAFSLYFSLLDRIGPTESNLIVYLEPVVATALSWLVFGEVIDSQTVVGFLAIFVGFLLVKHRSLLPSWHRVRDGLGLTHPETGSSSFENSD
ncbi:EamA/RhaT family transporter [Halorhabdus sp. CBA1104]|uniref:DMT family transporter n=1 Tax=unclassified Halorhabdus TaxID=2621901 RepID=UPI0012B25903|nr:MULTISPECIES: EamA family transporter [unclassified Halorhabdus]QGN07438.1 EamA/RhaT family transporter [Halorhabdus sp. CBA1104]